MIPAVGRNEPCPCGSGKKYKRCCMGKAEPVTASSDLPFPTVAEEFALRSVLSMSRPFRALYDAERSHVDGPLHWTTFALLAGEGFVRALRLPSGQQVMFMRQVPAPSDTASAVAEELMQFVLDGEGFPLVLADGDAQQYAAGLNNLLHRPLIIGRMRQHGFDWAKHAQREIKKVVEQLTTARPIPERAAYLGWALTYSCQVLEWRAMLGGADSTAIAPFERWFDQYEPEIALQGRAIVQRVESMPYDTPEALRTLLHDLIGRYDLAQRCIVRTRREQWDTTENRVLM